VQALWSPQGAVLFACRHPATGSQLSSVQTLLSLQLRGSPPTHCPPLQVSPVVQALLSLQGAELFVWVQPDAGLHPSSVQGLLSLQLSGVPAWQVPPLHTSWPLHTVLSSHAVPFATLVQVLVLTVGWQDSQLLAGLRVPPAYNVPPMRQPGWHRLHPSAAAWQTSPAQHWLSLTHLDCDPVAGLHDADMEAVGAVLYPEAAGLGAPSAMAGGKNKRRMAEATSPAPIVVR